MLLRRARGCFENEKEKFFVSIEEEKAQGEEVGSIEERRIRIGK